MGYSYNMGIGFVNRFNRDEMKPRKTKYLITEPKTGAIIKTYVNFHCAYRKLCELNELNGYDKYKLIGIS